MRAVPASKQIIVTIPPATTGAIELSQASRERPQIGIVESNGKMVTEYHPGDKVCFTRFNINEIKFEGEQLYIMTEEQILFKVVE